MARHSDRIIVRAYDGAPLAQACSKCDELKLLDDFVKNARSLLGIAAHCKDCHASTNRRYHASKAGDAGYRERRRESARRSSRRYRTANPETVRATVATIRERRRNRTDDEVAADRARLRPDGMKVCGACRLSLPLSEFYSCRVEADGLSPRCGPCIVARQLKINLADLAARWADLDLYVCAYCGADFEEIEHVIPRTQDGVDHVENLVPSCRECNRGRGGKFAQTPAEWQPETHRAIRLAVAQVREARAAIRV